MQVQKKDGSLQEFDSEKIVNGLLNSGLSDEEAEDLASEVEDFFIESAKETISWQEIKTKVLELLKEVNPDAAQMFENYKKQ